MCSVVLRPVCSRHPQARVKRNGYYGKGKQYALWRCAGAAGDRPHQVRPELSVSLVGGQEGGCDHCELPWEPPDGLPQAVGDRFVLLQKAETLVSLGRGSSYSGGGVHGAPEGWSAKGDARQEPCLLRRPPHYGDWVEQYADIVAQPLLPDRWPWAIAIDELEIRLLVPARWQRPAGGGDASTIMAVVGYENADGEPAVLVMDGAGYDGPGTGPTPRCCGGYSLVRVPRRNARATSSWTRGRT
jgi:hypothetical protein